LHAHTPVESSRAGHQQNTSARTRERTGSIPLGIRVLQLRRPFHLLPAVTPSGPAYHRRWSCAERRTRTALLLPQPPHGWRELVMPGCTASPPSSSHPTAAFASQLLLPTCRAITAPPPPRGSRSACIRVAPSVAFSSTASEQCVVHHRSWLHFSCG
jgi:hypothetical protein